MNTNLICRSLWIKRDIHAIDECNDNSKKPYVKVWCMFSIKSLKSHLNSIGKLDKSFPI